MMLFMRGLTIFAGLTLNIWTPANMSAGIELPVVAVSQLWVAELDFEFTHGFYSGFMVVRIPLVSRAFMSQAIFHAGGFVDGSTSM